MPAAAASYAERCAAFRWSIPAAFNIAAACCDRRAADTPDRPALVACRDDGSLVETGFGALAALSARLAGGLARRGLGRGDRIAILLPQSVETVAAHLAAYRLGAIAVPLAPLFGTDAIAYRLRMSGATALVTDGTGLAKLAAVEGDLACRDTVLCVDGPSSPAEDFHRFVHDAAPLADTAATGPDDPAMMIFTSGTTGPPKGVLHGHRVLLAHLPGVAFSHHGFPADGDRFWTPSDWAWAGGLLNALLPALFHGVPVAFGPFRKFDPQAAADLVNVAGVRNVFVPPTAIRLLRTDPAAARRFGRNLRTIAAAGESLGRETGAWAQTGLGLPVNEFYGQTECNYVLGSSAALGVARPGAIGKPVPGHRVALVDDDGTPVAAGERGVIAIHRDDPGMFLGYWNDDDATAARFRGDWMLTGDLATDDDDGYVTFVGRNDDLIISSGYRIGPVEIEDCLQTHPAVAMAAVVGKPDPVRTEIVKAFVVPAAGVSATPALERALRDHVRQRLSATEMPREVAFVDEIPLTTSGKVVRRHFRRRAVAEAEAEANASSD